MSYDTHETVKRLKGANFSEDQAEALATILRDQRQNDLSQLATKIDLELLKRDLTIRLGGMIAVGVGFLTASKFFG
ncbi:hypothetical protein [Azospirillum sp. SYSU D00513]|uniref:hypothetical protein n=1 Tax=Azospirillum sp. SYSU D00513 TaxID=2812561 RepID=UPI001A968970|nr:hypothetical protein [Azospirillum sp. SYSU D00513]